MNRTGLVNSLLYMTAIGIFGGSLIYFGPSLPQWWHEQTSGRLAIEDPDTLYATAQNYYRDGDLNMAHDIANRAIIVSHDYVPAHKLLVAIYIKQNKFAAAEEACRKAEQIAPRDTNIKLALSVALRKQGKIKEAAKVTQDTEGLFRDMMADKKIDQDEVMDQMRAMEQYAEGKPAPSLPPDRELDNLNESAPVKATPAPAPPGGTQ